MEFEICSRVPEPYQGLYMVEERDSVRDFRIVEHSQRTANKAECDSRIVDSRRTFCCHELVLCEYFG
jgi:hypothetical protein